MINVFPTRVQLPEFSFPSSASRVQLRDHRKSEIFWELRCNRNSTESFSPEFRFGSTESFSLRSRGLIYGMKNIVFCLLKRTNTFTFTFLKYLRLGIYFFLIRSFCRFRSGTLHGRSVLHFIDRFSKGCFLDHQ